jgi:HPt (histidine-containing phosphotransfer) domain-containing protein
MLTMPLYDREKALAQIDGDAALFAEIAAVLAAEGESYCAALETALASGDTAGLRREAHTVKSVLASFACEGGRELAWRLEEQAASGSLDGAPERVAELVAVVRQLMAELAAQDA